MSDQITSNDDRVADDILRGAEEIGAELRLSKEAVYYIFSKQEKDKRQGKAVEDHYPIVKLGKMLQASRRALRRAHKRRTSAT